MRGGGRGGLGGGRGLSRLRGERRGGGVLGVGTGGDGCGGGGGGLGGVGKGGLGLVDAESSSRLRLCGVLLGCWKRELGLRPFRLG